MTRKSCGALRLLQLMCQNGDLVTMSCAAEDSHAAAHCY